MVAAGFVAGFAAAGTMRKESIRVMSVPHHLFGSITRRTNCPFRTRTFRIENFAESGPTLSPMGPPAPTTLPLAPPVAISTRQRMPL